MKVRWATLLITVLLILMFSGISAAVPQESPAPDLNITPYPRNVVSLFNSAFPDNLTERVHTRLRGGSPVTASSDPAVIPQRTVYDHFLTIAYSDMNYRLMRQQPKKPLVFISLYGNYTDDDKATVEEFLADFNHVSPSLKFYPVTKADAEGADYWINVLPEADLHRVNLDIPGNPRTPYIQYQGSVLSDTILYETDLESQVFVNGDLTGDRRRHYLLRGITYCMGLTGDATDPESFFYPGNEHQTELTETDWRAIRLMYGPVMERNLTVYEAMGRLYT